MSFPVPLIAAACTTASAALFACAHVALTSLSEARLAALVENSDKYRNAIERLARDRDHVHARYLVGAVSSSFASVAGFTIWLFSLDVAPWARASIAVAGMLVQCAVLETAATLGRRSAESVVPLAARYLRPLELMFAPLGWLTHTVVVALPLPVRREDSRITETEVEMMVAQGAKSGALASANAELIRNVLEFPELTVRDAMLPRKQVVGIRLDTPLENVVELVTRTGHSRYPVYRETIDDAFALVYAKDLFRALMKSPAGRISTGDGSRDSQPAPALTRLIDVVREPLKIVPESRPLSELLPEMRQDRLHMALVVDEFGGTSGVVTLEDILEEIVGDIRDEHDPEVPPIHALDDGSLLVDATVLMCDLSAFLGCKLDPDDKYDSLGGMIVDQLGRVPSEGTTLESGGVVFTVHQADEKRVQKVAVLPPVSLRPPASRAEPRAESSRAESPRSPTVVETPRREAS